MASRNRGKGKENLVRYGIQHPTTQELSNLTSQMNPNSQPIVRAITGQSIVELHLEKLIRNRLRKNDDETWNSLLLEPGPLSSFSKKIQIAYAMGIINDITKNHLITIGRIRNAFAHTKKPLTFKHNLIRGELRKLTLPKNEKTKLYRDILEIRDLTDITPDGPDAGFTGLCFIVACQFLDKELRILKDKTRRLSKRGSSKTEMRRDLAKALMYGFSTYQEEPLKETEMSHKDQSSTPLTKRPASQTPAPSHKKSK